MMMSNTIVQELKTLCYPKYWGYWLLLGILLPITWLPSALRMGVGRILGRVMMPLVRYRKQVVQTNIARAFPHWTEKARRKLYQQFAASVGQGFIETAMAWFWSESRLRAISRIEGEAQSLALLRDRTQPVVLVGSHSTLLELGVRLLGIYVDSAGMYRPLKNPFFHRWIKYQRSRAATELVHFKDMRCVLNILKKGENIWYALDQDMGRRVSIFAPFFTIPTASVNILGKLHKRTGAHAVPVFIWREGYEYVVRVLPEIPLQSAQSDEAIMTAVNAVYEEQILQHPEQYFWLHRRFKTRPNAQAPNWYPKRHK